MMKNRFSAAVSAVCFMIATAFISSACTYAESGDNSAESPNTQIQNNRMKTLEGSKSRWSSQFNLTYNGSSVTNPFSDKAPNPGNQVPPPLVSLSGTASARYRIDPKTTIGLGMGLTTQTPFQGPKNTTLADPAVDIARSYTIGPLYNRADLIATVWTNNQYHDTYGYRYGLTYTNESFYLFPFGLTAGLALQLDYNFFASGQYDSSQQTQYDFWFQPYFEYRLSKRFNLRSVIGLATLHNRNTNNFFSQYRPDTFQTLGLGTAISDAVFFYPFLRFFPFSGNLSAQTTLVGFNIIINGF